MTGGPPSAPTVEDQETLEQMDIHEIIKYLPHRYPFLLVDRVLECTPGESAVAIKNVTINEPFFQGHFPQRAIMPGVLVLEAMAQVCGLLAFKSTKTEPDDKNIFYLVGIDKARFKRPVEPGDQLRLEVDFARSRRGIWVFSAKATVEGQLCAEAEIMCTMRTL